MQEGDVLTMLSGVTLLVIVRKRDDGGYMFIGAALGQSHQLKSTEDKCKTPVAMTEYCLR